MPCTLRAAVVKHPRREQGKPSGQWWHGMQHGGGGWAESAHLGTRPSRPITFLACLPPIHMPRRCVAALGPCPAQPARRLPDVSPWSTVLVSKGAGEETLACPSVSCKKAETGDSRGMRCGTERETQFINYERTHRHPSIRRCHPLAGTHTCLPHAGAGGSGGHSNYGVDLAPVSSCWAVHTTWVIGGGGWVKPAIPVRTCPQPP